jgi:hypothetical protein
MALDPSIILQGQQIQLADPTKQAANAYLLKNMADEQQAKQQAIQQQQLLQQAFSQGDMSTPQGQQALIRSVSGIDPSRAQALSKQFQEQALQQSTIGKNNAETDASKFKQIQEKQGMVASAASTPLLQYQNLIAKGVPEAQARAQVEPVYQASLMRLQSATGPDGQPLFAQQDFASIPANFDPSHVEGIAQQATKYQELAKQQLDAQQAIETKRNNLANNATSQQNANSASMNAQTNRGELAQAAQRLGFDKDKFMLEYGQKGSAKQGEMSESLRKEFDQLAPVKNYNQALPAFSAIKDAASRNTTSSNINLVYGIAKLYDPNSVVREGEYASIANSPNIPERIKGYASYLQGGGKLSENTIKQIVTEGEGRFKTYEDQYHAVRNDYKSIANKTGIDETLVFPSDRKILTAPSVGEVRDGYRFKGGNPSSQSSWEKS